MFRIKSQRASTWIYGEKAMWNVLPSPARHCLLTSTHSECSVVACHGVPGYALAVQNGSRYHDTGFSERVSHYFSYFLLCELIFLIIVCIWMVERRLVCRRNGGGSRGKAVATLKSWLSLNSWPVSLLPLQVTKSFFFPKWLLALIWMYCIYVFCLPLCSFLDVHW